jgi:hypothetical protein
VAVAYSGRHLELPLARERQNPAQVTNQLDSSPLRSQSNDYTLDQRSDICMSSMQIFAAEPHKWTILKCLEQSDISGQPVIKDFRAFAQNYQELLSALQKVTELESVAA